MVLPSSLQQKHTPNFQDATLDQLQPNQGGALQARADTHPQCLAGPLVVAKQHGMANAKWGLS